jgi:purine-binding chemotaxis protein CheW
LRKLFLLPQRELELSDHLIITIISRNKIALWVDKVSEIMELNEEEITNTEKILLDVDYVQGLFKLHDGMVVIHDLEKFLTPEQIARLEASLIKKVEQKQKKNPKRNINKTVEPPR